MSNFETIRLEKEMYGVPGKSFTQVLEDLDRSSQYEGTPLGQLDAYQRQLKRFDIHVSGAGSDPVEKFFQTSDSAALFPEYVSRAVRQGMEQENLLPSLVATTTTIHSMDYRTITSDPDDDEKQLKPVAEGATIPQTAVRTKSSLVHLHKRGRMLVSTYEALRFQRLDLFTVTLRQIGAHIARTQLDDAVKVLLHGDAGDSPAKQLQISGSKLAYSDLIALWGALTPFRMNALLASTAGVQELLRIEEFKDAAAGLNFQATGKMITPLGAKLLHAPGLEDGKLIALDSSCALEMVQAGGVTTEYDKLIERQLERASITVITGFSRIFDGAVAVLSTGAAGS